MRVLSLSDTHYPVSLGLTAFESAMLKQAPDLVVIAGDMLDCFDEQRMLEYLEILARYEPPKLCVIGNHDLWHEDRDTKALYEFLERFAWSDYGVHLLNTAPYEHDASCSLERRDGTTTPSRAVNAKPRTFWSTHALSSATGKT